jgi:hypothetical protein
MHEHLQGVFRTQSPMQRLWDNTSIRSNSLSPARRASPAPSTSSIWLRSRRMRRGCVGKRNNATSSQLWPSPSAARRRCRRGRRERLPPPAREQGQARAAAGPADLRTPPRKYAQESSTQRRLSVFVPLFAFSGIEGRLFAPLGAAYIARQGRTIVVSALGSSRSSNDGAWSVADARGGPNDRC